MPNHKILFCFRDEKNADYLCIQIWLLCLLAFPLVCLDKVPEGLIDKAQIFLTGPQRRFLAENQN